MPLGVDGQQYQDEFHAIYSQIDGPTHVTIHPEAKEQPVQEPMQSAQEPMQRASYSDLNSPGTSVPDSNLNAPAGSVEPPRGLPDVEDRRGENYSAFTWDNFMDTVMQTGVDLGNGLFGPRSIPEAPVSTLSKALGHEDIKLGGELDSRSLLDSTYDDVTDGLTHFSKAFGGGTLGSQEPLSEWEFSKGTKVGNKLFGTGGEDRYQLWPEKMVRSALSAAGDALQGKTPDWAIDAEGNVNTSIQTIEKAQDLANLAVLGPAPLAGKLADGTLGSFAGVRSATVDRGKLYKAQNLEFDGVHPEQIYQETGFFKGADGRWRYEVPNDMSNLKASGTEVIPADPMNKSWTSVGGDRPDRIRIKSSSPDKLTTEQIQNMHPDELHNYIIGAQSLKDVLHNPELFKAYPFLKNLTVKNLPETGTLKGQYSPSEQAIYMTPAKADDFHSTLLHEVQHAIQEHEGFARGGNKQMFSTPEYENAKAIFEVKMDKFIKELKDKFPNADQTMGAIQSKINGQYESLSPMNKARIDSIIDKAKQDGYYNKMYTYVDAANKIDAAELHHYKSYRRIMGEVEARNVQRRIDFSDLDRQLNSPMRTEELDTPRSEQINSNR